MSLASQSVAGSLLIDAACLLAVRQQVRADDFEVAADRAIFEAACRLADAGQAIDVVAIVQNARKHGADISDEYAATLMKVTPTAANAAQYASAVHSEAVRRRLSDIGMAACSGKRGHGSYPCGYHFGSCRRAGSRRRSAAGWYVHFVRCAVGVS